jgi:hypothetical protein
MHDDQPKHGEGWNSHTPGPWRPLARTAGASRGGAAESRASEGVEYFSAKDRARATRSPDAAAGSAATEPVCEGERRVREAQETVLIWAASTGQSGQLLFHTGESSKEYIRIAGCEDPNCACRNKARRKDLNERGRQALAVMALKIKVGAGWLRGVLGGHVATAGVVVVGGLAVAGSILLVTGAQSGSARAGAEPTQGAKSEVPAAVSAHKKLRVPTPKSSVLVSAATSAPVSVEPEAGAKLTEAELLEAAAVVKAEAPTKEAYDVQQRTESAQRAGTTPSSADTDDGLPHWSYSHDTVTGKLRRAWMTVHGRTEGLFYTYRADGTLQQVQEFRNSKPDGIQLNYSKDGQKVVRRVYFKAGVLDYAE